MKNLMTQKEEREAFDRFRHVLVRRAWELIITCNDHRALFRHLFPSRSRKDPYAHMEKDKDGEIRHKIQEDFAVAYPDVVDCPRGDSLALSLIIEDLKKLKGELARRNMGLVHQSAIKYQWLGKRVGLDKEDLVQYGCIGLCKGIERFRPEFGYKFCSYSVWWIRHEILRAIQNGGLVRIPVHMQVGESPEQYRNTLSLDQELSETNPYSFVDLVEDQSVGAHAQIQTQEEVQQLLEQLGRLDPRQRELLKMRFGIRPYKEPHTLAQIGEKFGVSRERVRQLETHAKIKIRKRLLLAS
jgi:RNA polymerase sigma factor (sigma-70 family)